VSFWLIRVGGPQRVLFFVLTYSPLSRLLPSNPPELFFLCYHIHIHIFSRTVVRWSRVRRSDIVFPPLAPSSGSSWPKSMSDGEAAVAFLRILLGCLVGTRCSMGPSSSDFPSDAIFVCRNGFFPRRDHVGVVSRAHEPRSRRQMEETRNPAAVHDPQAAQASPSHFCTLQLLPNLSGPPTSYRKAPANLDIPTYLCACSTLRSPSSCSSPSLQSGDHRSERTHHLPRTCTRYRSRAPSGISWMMTCSIGRG
jgi:hypothetical protein